jgi:LAS superfamily LD-carboxypeptidase LdcB
VASNAHKYGFIVRYQKGKQNIVGFSYEPWHLRYVGKELASELYKQKETMEGFFGYPAAPDYK